MKLARALEIEGKARIRRRIAVPSDNTEVSPPERSVELRDARGRYLKGWAGGPGRPPCDALRELYVDDLLYVWKTHGRKAIRQLAEESRRISADHGGPGQEDAQAERLRWARQRTTRICVWSKSRFPGMISMSSCEAIVTVTTLWAATPAARRLCRLHFSQAGVKTFFQ